MKFTFLIITAMSKKSGILTALATATVLATSPVSADTNNQTEQQKIEQKEVSKKVEQISCKTKLACERVSHSIQAQINELEKKGLENLTDDEFVKYSELSDQLIAVEKTETQQNSELIKAQNTAIMAQLSSIKGSL